MFSFTLPVQIFFWYLLVVVTLFLLFNLLLTSMKQLKVFFNDAR